MDLSIRKNILQSDGLEIAKSANSADFILEIELTNYRRRPEAFKVNDSFSAAAFSGTIYAVINLQKTEVSEPLIKDHVVDTTFYVSRNNRELPSDRQGLGNSANDLGRKVVTMVENLQW